MKESKWVSIILRQTLTIIWRQTKLAITTNNLNFANEHDHRTDQYYIEDDVFVAICMSIIIIIGWGNPQMRLYYLTITAVIIHDFQLVLILF